MKRIAFVSLCMATATAMAYTGNRANNAIYSEENGYVQFNGKMSDGGGNDGAATDKQSWTTGYNWDDGLAPTGDKDYYVSYAWRRIAMARASSEADALPFPGRSLFVACELYNYCAWGEWSNLGDNVTILGGARLVWNSIGHLTGTKLTLGNCSAEWPVYFHYSGRSDPTPYTVNVNVPVKADAGAHLVWELKPESTAAMGAKFVIGSNWPEFYGTLTMASSNNTFSPATFSMPGNIVVSNAATFLLTGASGTSTLGGLSVMEGTKFGFDTVGNTQTVTVTGKLDFAAGATFVGKKFSSWVNGAPPTYTVFTLSPEAVAAGVPDMSQAVYDFAGCGNANRSVPNIKWTTTPLEGGGASLGVTYNEIVTITNGMSFYSSAFHEDGAEANDPAHFLSDGRAFHGGVDYYARGKNLIMLASAYPYVFRGDSLILDNGTALAFYGSFTCTNLVLFKNGRFRMMNGATIYDIDGGIKLLRDPSQPASPAWRFNVGNRSTYNIKADISGDGNMFGLIDPEAVNNIVNWTGGIELSGDNSAYTGRIVLYAGKAGDFATYFDSKGHEPFAPSAVSNVTLTVHRQANLGGPLPEFDANSLCVSNHCRVVLADTATFDEPTRGWCFPQIAYVKVADGAIATVKSPVTYGTRLVKEGAGALVLGSAPLRADASVRPVLEVAEGAVGVAATNALAGLDVTFAAGTGLHVPLAPEDADVRTRGAVLTDTVITAPDGIAVSFGAEGLPVSGVATVAIATVDTASADAFAAKLMIARIDGSRITVTPVPNGDGTTTLMARVAPAGVRIILR